MTNTVRYSLLACGSTGGVQVVPSAGQVVPGRCRVRVERGMTPMKVPGAREPRGVKEGRTVKVETRCTPREREMIIARAASVEMRLSDYLRTAALHSEVRSKADKHAVRALAGYTGELGRLGGLLKLWLSERRGDGAPAIEVDRVLAQITAMITRMDEEMEKL